MDNPAAGLTKSVNFGWASFHQQQLSSKRLITTIADPGNCSKEIDAGVTIKLGQILKNIVRLSLEFLGFTIDYAHKGGGGLDYFAQNLMHN